MTLPRQDLRPCPHTVMVLAAGLGTRMRPLTATTAKVLLPLGGRSLLDRALDRLSAVHVERVVVNTHWHAERVEAQLDRWPGSAEIVIQRERELLDTGGSVRRALPELG